MSNCPAKGDVPDAALMFQAAERFREAAEFLQEHQATGKLPLCSCPMLTVDAFAAEVYLKCLYVVDEGRPAPRDKRGHRCEWLFSQLREATKLDIRERWMRDVAHHPVHMLRLNPKAPHMDFSEVLAMVSDTFESTRYLYEKGGVRPRGWFYVTKPHRVVRDVLLSRRPEWQASSSE